MISYSWRGVLSFAPTAAIVAALACAVVLVTTLRAPQASAAAPCTGGTVAVVAHPDDDLFFQSPDLPADVTAGACVTIVYVTSGDAGHAVAYSRSREVGVQAAWALNSKSSGTWSSSTSTAGGHSVDTRTLSDRPLLRLMFLHLPDGNTDGRGFASTGFQTLPQLEQGTITSLSTIDGPAYTYSRASLIATLGDVLSAAAPTKVRTLDFVGAYNDGDHPDHHAVGRFTVAARDASYPAAAVYGYQGYGIASRPVNVTGTAAQAKSDALYAYAPNDPEMCQTPAACSARPEGSWLVREYIAGSSAGSTASPTGSPSSEVNVASGASVTASSQNTSTGQVAVKAVDGVVDGYPGNYQAEWATVGGGAGSTLTLTWSQPVSLGRVALYDRPNSNDQVTGGRLTFSDGSTVSVPSLTNDGSATSVSFSARSTTSLTFTVTSVSASTSNVGLAELAAYTG